jgi:beta-glucosidase
MWTEEHRNWNEVDFTSLKDGTAFPKEFMWGVATASHQIEGGNTNNWSAFEPRSKSQQLSGDACDHWNLRSSDVGLIADLGVSHYRFSIEWSRIVPEPGAWDDEAAQWYSELVDELLLQGIQPMATLHHFTQPIWWEERGGFEREENIQDWVDFSKRMFALLNDRVKWWCTINEPAVFTTMGYVLGEFPPGVRSFKRARAVSMNLMRAHARCYQALKSMDGGPHCDIGLVKNINLFDPYRRWNPLHWLQARVLDGMFNRCWIKGLKTGRFKPPSSLKSTKIAGLKGSSDFIGVNYYTHLLATPFMPTKVEIDPLIRPWEQRTDFRYPMYAVGLRRAFEMVQGLNLPIIVTENGVADDDDDMRPEHIRRHLQITAEAIADGIDVRGFYHWSLMDNFEWAEGYDQRFGLYHVDFETNKRTLKESGKEYATIVKAHRTPQVVIMAGGLGTRLGALTETIPKSLIEVNGKPILTHILNWASKQGCQNALVLTGHLGEQFEGFTHPRVAINVHREPSPLGTGGALWNARDLLEERFILLWGDDLHPIDYTSLLETHAQNAAPLTMTVTEDHATMNLRHSKGALLEYSKKESNDAYNGYEAGTSVVEKSVVLEHGKEGVWSWEETVYPALSGKASVHLDSTRFWDMGTPERLALLEKFLNETAL